MRNTHANLSDKETKCDWPLALIFIECLKDILLCAGIEWPELENEIQLLLTPAVNDSCIWAKCDLSVNDGAEVLILFYPPRSLSVIGYTTGRSRIPPVFNKTLFCFKNLKSGKLEEHHIVKLATAAQ